MAPRCERSPTPERVGANTVWPASCRISATRCQHQPPNQAPWIKTNVDFVSVAAVGACEAAKVGSALKCFKSALRGTPDSQSTFSIVAPIRWQLRANQGPSTRRVQRALGNRAPSTRGYVNACADARPCAQADRPLVQPRCEKNKAAFAEI